MGRTMTAPQIQDPLKAALAEQDRIRALKNRNGFWMDEHKAPPTLKAGPRGYVNAPSGIDQPSSV